jgi:Domain of unknown function (DUF4145)
LAPVILRSLCNVCSGETDHEVLHQETSSQEGEEGRLETKHYTLRCRGCHDASMRTEDRYFEFSPFGDDATLTVSFQPPRLWRRPPDWLSALEDLDPDLNSLLKEVYSAANDDQAKLLSMGIRASLDHLMNKVLGGDLGSFEQKLSEMVKQDHLTKSQKQSLEVVIDAGSASSHRGYRPPKN